MDNSLFNFKASHLMLSTNPKLTTNVRIMVDSNSNIFLESFDVNNELSKSKFKKFRVSPGSLYNKDIYNFYDKGKFPKNFAYQIFKSDTDLKVLKDFSRQYDNFYKYGTQRLISKLYEEEASIFAPLWLNEYIPKYFVIFKADGPVYNNFTEDILNKSTIIKTIDLTENSNIGRYIRNYQKIIPSAPITFSPEQDEMTYFNGIDYISGAITSKGKFIHTDYINKDKSIIEYDNYITKKFEENGIIVANLLNLEFLFNDDISDKYSINRYFGLYIDNLQEGDFELDIETMYQKKHIDRFQTIFPKLISQPRKKFFVEGIDGTTIYAKNIETDIELYQYDKIKDLNTLFYTKDSDKNFYLIDKKSRWEENAVRLSNNYLNLNKFISTSSSNSFVDIDRVASESKSHVIFRIENDIPNSFGFKFYDVDEMFLEVYCDLTLTMENQNDTDFYFVGTEKKKNIAISIAKAINNMGRNQIAAYSKDDLVVVYSVFFGSRFNGLRFEFKNRNLDPALFITEYSNNNYFVGGSNPKDSRYIVDEDNIDQFYEKFVVLKNGDVERADVGFYIDDPARLETMRSIVLKNKPKFNNTQIILVNKFQINFGRFNIYPVRDFDFDFYSNNYEQNEELVFEKNYYEVETATPIDIFTFYEENNLYELTNNEINEYAVNKENYNLDFATASKVVPYINKWVYKNGQNIRESAYRLNSAKVFGIYNRTPSNISKNQNLDAYTHDWYYMKYLPEYYSNNETIATSYINTDVIVDDFYSITEDNFVKAFVYNQIDDVKLEANQYKFSIFEGGNAIDESISFFKGVKVITKEKVDDNVLVNYNIDNLKFKTDYAKFNDYKFSTILINDPTFFESDYKIKVIKNEKFKFIVAAICTNIDFTEKLDRTILYSLKNKYKESGEFEDGVLRGTIDLESILFTGDHYIIKGGYDKENIPSEFTKQIKVDVEGKFFQIEFDFNGITYRIYDIFRVLSNDTLLARKFQSDNGSFVQDLYDFPMIIPSKRDMGYLNYDSNTSSGISIKSGGFNFYKDLMDTISFANIYSDINEGNPNVDYVTIQEDGTIVNKDYIIQLTTPNLIAMPLYIEKTPDPNKPINFNFVSVIGYRLKLKPNVEVAPFYKHIGNFTPQFKDIFKFIDPHVLDPIIDPTYKEKVLALTKDLNTNISTVNNIENKFFHKVTDKDYNILELESNPDFNSIYPLINECAFDFRDMDVFKTNWGSDYYLNYIEKNMTEFITLYAMKEQKDYFGSKYMKTPFKIVIEKDIEYTYENYIADVIIQLDIRTALLNYFSNLIKGFPDYDTEIEYITNNIMMLYETSKVDLYVKKVINGGTVNFDNMASDDAEKQINKLKISSDYQLSNNNNLDVEIIYHKFSGTSYLFGVSVEITLI